MKLSQTDSVFDLVIIGGGAAGFMAGIACAENNPGLRIGIFERSSNVLSKVRVSGGGRCNVTHSCFDPETLTRSYPRGGRELRGPFHVWQPANTVDWFQSRGVRLKTEADGRMFPVTDSSQTIIDCLIGEAKSKRIRIQTGREVVQVDSNGFGFEVLLSNGEKLTAERMLVASGGLKKGPILNLIRESGHSIEPLAPSLFTFSIKDDLLKGLQGTSVEHCEASIPGTRLVQSGPMLVTHLGLSGPVILKLSAWGARWIQDQSYRFSCDVNWTGTWTQAETRDRLKQERTCSSRKRISGTPLFDLSKRLWPRLTERSGIPDDLPWSRMSSTHLESLFTHLTRTQFQVTGKSMNKEEFVTCGGVRLKEINFKTMESRKVPGLHFAGEVLDIDAVTGGFNFQAAWTTGVIAGRAVAECLQSCRSPT
ncbi:MAG TPA: NAD(P)/FAD-dependent oxidoreductase [Verrucomicrobiales bacterium]|nr:NAD(P)/FAD-dependent oxidoreductase [Verrucomicrobiales bacterium]